MFENMSKDTKELLGWIGTTILVGIMWTLPGWLIVLGVI